MLKHIAYVGLIAAALAAPPVFAQTAGGQTTEKMAPAAQAAPPATPDTAKPATPTPNPSTASTSEKSDTTFVTQQAKDQWRASKLVGVGVYGPDQKKIGSIKDILVDHDGKAQVIVVSVGGFLGIGSKDVGIPFSAMQWRTEGRAAATNPPPSSTSGTGNGMAPNQGAASRPTSPQDVEASQGYPDRGVLAMTESQLKNAPDFHYAAENNAANAPASSSTATKP
jgi:sporulation protein YlmC with PRC-barrel domain